MIDYFSKMFTKNNQFIILFYLFIIASPLRLYAFIFGMDIPGDGPVKAIIAYNWSKSPHLLTHGVWLPGFTYLTGIFSYIFDNPLYSVRLINLIVGTCTVPLFYAFIYKVFDPITALFSALILAFLPLHIGLSASSLTEITFLFEIFSGTLLLIIASEYTKNRKLYIILSIIFLCIAEMSRYESWLLMPLLASYYLWRTRKISEAILMTIVLIAFPLAWSIGNYSYYGDPFIGFHGAIKGAEALGASPVNILGTIKIIGKKLVSHLGWILSVSVIAGLTLQFIQATRKKSIEAKRLLYIAMFFLYWAVMFKFTMTRGKSMFDRYLILVFVMALPFATMPFVNYVKNNLWKLVMVFIVAITSIGISFSIYKPAVYFTPMKRTAIQNLAIWLKNSPYSADAILMTKLGWKSTYLPLYFPEIGSRNLIVSYWRSDSDIRDFIETRQPSLLITRYGDEKYKSRIESILGRKIGKDLLIHTEDSSNYSINIYDIRRLVDVWRRSFI